MSSGSPAPESDDDLAARARAGDRGAFQTLYDRHAPAVMGFLVNRIERPDAEDIHQEVWMRAYRNLHRFQGGSFRAWVFEIARHCLIDLFRRRGRAGHASIEGEFVDYKAGGPLQNMLNDENQQRLGTCLSKLDGDLRRIAEGRLGGLSSEEIGEQLGLTAEQVHRRWHTAKVWLTDCVNGGDR